MTNPADIENQLAADVEDLKKQFLNTQVLYKEVCALMFLRYGITPTVNRLYQLVRRGSMSVPSDALRQFWQELREKSRVRIEHPDLPEALKTAAAESIAAMWTLAQQAAVDGLTAARNEAANQVRAAEAAARDQAAAFEAAEARLSALLDTERRRADDLAARLGDREAAYARLAEQRTSDHAAHVRQLAAARQAEAIAASERDVARKELLAAQAEGEKNLATFNAQLDRFREDSAASEARHLAIERRALLDLDQERQRNNRLGKQLEQVQQRLTETMSEQARATATLQNQIGSLQGRLGEAEGRLAAAREDSSRWEAACERLQGELARQQDASRAQAETNRRDARLQEDPSEPGPVAGAADDAAAGQRRAQPRKPRR
jgi:hypothetical protein